jgi:hypothetical protein
LNESATSSLRVEAGTVAVLRLYDVANAIDVARAEREAASATTTRIQLMHTKPKAVSFGVPPLEIALGHIEVGAGPLPLRADVTARIYDFGAVSLAFRFRADGLVWDDFVDLVDRDVTYRGDTHCDSEAWRRCERCDCEQGGGSGVAMACRKIAVSPRTP